MTKRFKHIPTGDIYKKDNYSYFGPFQIVPQSIVEDKNSKDWEEVKEKTYRIVKIKNPSGVILTYDEKGICIDRSDNAQFSIKNTITLKEAFVYPYNCSIYLVERLSDGQLFSIEDNTNFGSISKFEIKEDDIIVYLNNVIGWNFLQSLKKLQTPIFITEDGVKCYANNHPELFWVELNDFTTGSNYKNCYNSWIKRDNFKFFAKKENRDEWIIENKRLFNIEEIKKYCPTFPIHIDILKHVAKSRL